MHTELRELRERDCHVTYRLAFDRSRIFHDKKSLFCRAIAPIRRGFTLNEMEVEKGRESGASFSLEFEAPRLFLLCRFLLLASHIVGNNLLVHRANSSVRVSRLCICIHSVSYVDIFYVTANYFAHARTRKERDKLVL